MTQLDLVRSSLDQARAALDNLMSNRHVLDDIACAGSILAGVLQAGHRVYSAGNGGSMCDAMHFAEELSGRFRADRAPLPAQAISDVGHLTCVSNDYGYDQVFSRYIEAHGRPGDLLLAISTSGESPSIIMAANAALDKGMVVIGLHGAAGCTLHKLADVSICTTGTSGYADRVQELHIKVIHILIELVEHELRKSVKDRVVKLDAAGRPSFEDSL